MRSEQSYDLSCNSTNKEHKEPNQQGIPQNRYMSSLEMTIIHALTNDVETFYCPALRTRRSIIFLFQKKQLYEDSVYPMQP